MKRGIRRVLSCFLAMLMVCSVVMQEGAATLKGVYFTGANDQLLTLSSETMPFWVGDRLYICQTAFEGTDLGVRFIRNYSMGVAFLYTPKTNLQFHLANQTVCDKNGKVYSGYAIEKNGIVFFPIDLVCRYFGLTWSLNETKTAPLVRIKSADAILNDEHFIAAASSMMASRYAAYEKLIKSQEQEKKPDPDPEPTPNPTPSPTPDPAPDPTPTPTPPTPENPSEKQPEKEPDSPPVHALEGQRVYLILAGRTDESIRETIKLLGGTGATFLLTTAQMENGDLLRTLLGSGHEVALMIRSTEEEEVREELLRGRELMRMASCGLLQLVWYEGETDISALLEEQGCVRVSAGIDRHSSGLRSKSGAEALLRKIGTFEVDVSVYLGYDENFAQGLKELLSMLREAQYTLCPWRLTA